jgi:hypothetical protein
MNEEKRERQIIKKNILKMHVCREFCEGLDA